MSRGNRVELMRDRLMARVRIDDATGCWLWTLVPTTNGYGLVRGDEGRKVLAHRAAYQEFVGPIPAGFTIDHLCRVRTCINPAHLEAVTNRVNVLRGDTLPAANAAKTHCPQGHPYDEANTRHGSRGSRNCRICDNARGRQWRATDRGRQWMADWKKTHR